MIQGHHNTTNLSGPDLVIAEEKAKTQQEVILEIFKKHPDKEFTPLAVWRMTEKKYIHTSVRRAMSNLADAGLLEKTNRKIVEEHGSINYTWKLAKVYAPGEQTNLDLE